MVYLALEELNFIWKEEQVLEFESMWRNNKTLKEISVYFKRPPDEILLLALDRAKTGDIKRRKGGLIGIN